MPEYLVQPGDTIFSISRMFGLRTEQLLHTNPNLQYNSLIAGQTLNITENKLMRSTIKINGFFNADRDPALLNDIYPYLTYLSIVNCRVLKDGSLFCENDDKAIVASARSANVAPLMVISNYVLTTGYSGELAHDVLSDKQALNNLFENIEQRMSTTQYFGINFDFENVPYADYDIFASFIQELSNQLHPLGYIVIATLRTNRIIGRIQENAEGFPVGNYENLADMFVIKTSEIICNPASNLSMIDNLQMIIDYVISPFSGHNILVSYPDCCHLWTHPYYAEQQPVPISFEQAELLASGGNGLEYDQNTNMYFYDYCGKSGDGYSIWCGSVLVNKEIVELIKLYELGGLSFRPADMFSLTTYQILGLIFNIDKVVI